MPKSLKRTIKELLGLAVTPMPTPASVMRPRMTTTHTVTSPVADRSSWTMTRTVPASQILHYPVEWRGSSGVNGSSGSAGVRSSDVSDEELNAVRLNALQDEANHIARLADSRMREHAQNEIATIEQIMSRYYSDLHIGSSDEKEKVVHLVEGDVGSAWDKKPRVS